VRYVEDVVVMPVRYLLPLLARESPAAIGKGKITLVAAFVA